ncbi:MAG: hypothetical protein JRN66_03905 [Nitrososphaerota archaeon]|nr:hypothetical protein [Nitrososphaerota archaeon]
MVLTKRLLVGLLIVLAFSATAYAGLSSTLNLMVVPAGSTGVAGPNGQPNPGGLPYNLTTLSGTFTVSVGKSQQITGVGLYNISNIISTYQNSLRISIYLTDPQDMGSVLHNPNSYINVSLYYPASNGAVTYNGSTYSYTGVSGIITRTNTVVILSTVGVTSSSSYLVLASITVPGGNPSGQQNTIGSLQFYINIRT